jgi:molecular chaperone DnaK (HSP70)
MIRLIKECNKLKETLSANKESSFFVEGLIGDDDFRSHITR